MTKKEVIERIDRINHQGIKNFLTFITEKIEKGDFLLKDIYIYNRSCTDVPEYAININAIQVDNDYLPWDIHYWCHDYLLPTARAVKAIQEFNEEVL